MRRTIVFATLASVMLGGAVLVYAGGWAVVTVRELPEFLTVNQPVTLIFDVRAHGMAPVAGLEPQVILHSRGQAIHAAVEPDAESGRYIATVQVPTLGKWTVQIRSGYGMSAVTLLPLRAAGTETTVALSTEERGRHLFVAKGCVSCHRHEATDAAQTLNANIGPRLSGRTFPADYLTRLLNDPDSVFQPEGEFVPFQPPGWRMPDLDLNPDEVASLVAFINGSGSTTE